MLSLVRASVSSLLVRNAVRYATVGVTKSVATEVCKLTEENRQKIRELLKHYPANHPDSAIMPALYIAQDQLGWLPPTALHAVAKELNVQDRRVYEVATFYTMFRLKPVGKYVVEVCTNPSCDVNGGRKILEALEKKLGVHVGGTTVDNKFTLLEVECQGACCGAPMMVMNKKYYENLTPEKVLEVVAKCE